MRISTLLRTRVEHVVNVRRSRESLAKRRVEKFRRLVRHAAAKSPYYRDLIQSLGIDVATATPEDFPPLTKTELIRSFDRIVTDPRVTRRALTEFLDRSKDPYELFQDEFYVVHTSGSSGELGVFVYSREDWSRGVAHSLRINPFRLRKRRLAFFGATKGHFAGVSLAETCRRPVLRHFYDVARFEITGPFAPVIEGLNLFQPDILMGYPTALTLLAERQIRGELAIAPTWVQTSGEPVLASQRERIEQAFGVPLLNVYACTEHLIMGVGRADFGGMYLFEDDLIFELHDDHTLITNLFNHTLPLIRYRMNDVLVEKVDPRPLLPFRKVEDIVGRSEHTPVFLNERGEEDFVSPFAFIEFVAANVRRFQLVVRDREACLFRVCLETGLEESERREALADVSERLAQIFADKDMRNVAVEVEAVDDLTPDPRTGKFRLIVVPGPAEAAVAS